MSNVPSVAIGFSFNSDTAGDRLVNANQLDTQFNNLAVSQNQTKAALDVITDANNALMAQSVGFSQLKVEVRNTLLSTYGSSVLTAAKVAVRLVAITNVATLAGVVSIDGVNTVSGDYVLLTGQTVTSQNGLWVTAAGAWARRSDLPAGVAQGNGWYVIAYAGVTRGGSAWGVYTTGTNIVGTDPIGFVSLSGFGVITQNTFATDVLYQVDTIADLKALTTKYATVLVRGYYTAGDGGGGAFNWNTVDVTADNGGTVIAPNTGGTGRWNRPTEPALNPRLFGAKGDGATNDAAAIMATYAALPATGGSIYFPPGSYKYNSQLDFSTRNIPLEVRGAGPLATRLIQNFSVLDGIKLNGASVTFSNFGFYPAVNGDRTAYMVNVNATNAYLVTIHDLFFNASLGNLISLDNISMLNMYAVNGVSTTGTNGDNCLRIKGVAAGTISNCYFKTGENGVTGPGSKPCLWMGGAAALSLTSLKITGCGFQGGGPRYAVGTRGITSTPTDFSIVMDAKNTEFKNGGYVVLRGITPAAYNGVFRINNVDNSGAFTVINVLSTLNPGASSVNGTVETLSACGYIENGLKSANESAITGCLFEALSWAGYGSAGLWLDGTQDTRYISGISLNGNYIDYGATSLVLQAFADAGTGVTVEGIDINGLQVSGSRRAVMIDGAVGVTLSGLNGTFGITSDNSNVDTLTNTALGSIGVAVLKGPANKCRGMNITGCNIGSSRTWDDNAQATGAMSTGVALDDTVDSVTIVGNNIYGYVTPMAINVSTGAAGMLWNIANNQFNNGTPLTAAKKIPTVASAASITAPIGYDTIKVSGVTTVTAMAGGYVGRVLNVVSTGAITYGPGAGFARAAGVATVAGQMTRFVWDGTQWAN